MWTCHPSASVVIPTHNRLEDLQRTVAGVEAQFAPGGRSPELVVVDDGSSDGTDEWLRRESSRGRLKGFSQRNAGPAVARNRGAAAATGEVVLFLGDDTVPEAGWLLAHLEEHRLHGGAGRPLAVVGYTGFPDADDTPFLRFINEYGPQFGYLLIDDPRRLAFNFFYTSNVSIDRAEMMRLGGFREDFPAAAWEDIEFAYRATKAGLSLRYQPLARAAHHHRVHPRTFCRRQRTSGRSAAIFAHLHPELAGFLGVDRARALPRGRSLRRALLGLAVGFGERVPGVVPPQALQRFVDSSYLEGLAGALQEASARR
jgi:GT2 family glycosyltransferase